MLSGNSQGKTVSINEIDELEGAVDLLGQQQTSHAIHDRVNFKPQEISSNPCFYDN